MLFVLHRPDLATPELYARLREHVPEGSEGEPGRQVGAWLGRGAILPFGLLALANALLPGESWWSAHLQYYGDGLAKTPCHSDAAQAGLTCILSLGATRTLRCHRAAAGCDGPDADGVEVEGVQGTVVVMDAAFQGGWHHRIVADERVKSVRLALVFRTKPEKQS